MVNGRRAVQSPARPTKRGRAGTLDSWAQSRMLVTAAVPVMAGGRAKRPSAAGCVPCLEACFGGLRRGANSSEAAPLLSARLAVAVSRCRRLHTGRLVQPIPPRRPTPQVSHAGSHAHDIMHGMGAGRERGHSWASQPPAVPGLTHWPQDAIFAPRLCAEIGRRRGPKAWSGIHTCTLFSHLHTLIHTYEVHT